jgi:hypothetical protein
MCCYNLPHCKRKSICIISRSKRCTLLPRVANFPGDISDKLAADSRFIELIKIEASFQTKFRSLSSVDKKLFQTCLKEKNTATMLVLFRKCGIDFTNYVASRSFILKALYNDYEIDKRSDKEQVFRAAISKLADPPTFAECLALFSSGSTLCTELCWGDDNCMLACWSSVMAAYLYCLSELP